MVPEKDDYQILHDLLLDNQELLRENNDLLRKMTRYHHWAVYLKILGFLVILGVPVALYYYIVEPYFETFSDSLQTLNSGLKEVPGWSQFIDAISHSR